jgi:hypothetical protein
MRSNIRVEQKISFVRNSVTRNNDLAEIKYTITNNDTSSHNVALRVLLDTMLGTNDGASFKVSGYGEVTHDREWDNDPSTADIPAIPSFCSVFDDLSNPKVISMLTLRSSYRVPDRLVLGYWPDAKEQWDYNISTCSFLDHNNDGVTDGSYPDSDSCAIIYWGYPSAPITLTAGSSVELVFYYGLSGMDFASWPPFNIGLTSPSEFTPVVTTGSPDSAYDYQPDPFKVTAYIENSSNNPIQHATIELNLPQEFSLAPGEQVVKPIESTSGSGSLSSHGFVEVSWNVETLGRCSGTRDISVTVHTSGGSKTVPRRVYINGLANAVYGQVTNRSNTVIAGATVQLYRNGTLIDNALTATNGTYCFSSLPNGTYEIRTTIPGMATVINQAVVSDAAASTNPIMSSPEKHFEALAYPNPVRDGNAHIRCFSPETKSLSVKIFNGAGNLITTLTADAEANSWTEVLWNIDEVYNGVYFYRIEGTSAAGKIAVLKRKK